MRDSSESESPLSDVDRPTAGSGDGHARLVLWLLWAIVGLSFVAGAAAMAFGGSFTGLGSGAGGLYGLPAILLVLVAIGFAVPAGVRLARTSEARASLAPGGADHCRRRIHCRIRLLPGGPHDRPLREWVVGPGKQDRITASVREVRERAELEHPFPPIRARHARSRPPGRLRMGDSQVGVGLIGTGAHHLRVPILCGGRPGGVFCTGVDEIVEGGFAAVGPVLYVVGVAPVRRPVTSRVTAAPVSHHQGPADRRWDHPGGAAHLQRRRSTIDDRLGTPQRRTPDLRTVSGSNTVPRVVSEMPGARSSST